MKKEFQRRQERERNDIPEHCQNEVHSVLIMMSMMKSSDRRKPETDTCITFKPSCVLKWFINLVRPGMLSFIYIVRGGGGRNVRQDCRYKVHVDEKEQRERERSGRSCCGAS